VVPYPSSPRRPEIAAANPNVRATAEGPVQDSKSTNPGGGLPWRHAMAQSFLRVRMETRHPTTIVRAANPAGKLRRTRMIHPM